MLQQRKYTRLREFDYASLNAYFITVYVKNFEPVLGTVKNGICRLSDIGNEIALNLQNIPEHYPYSLINEFIVMPNHFHCIIIITRINHVYTGNCFSKTVAGSVSTMIGHVKGAVTKWCKENTWQFQWQPRFHDHLIRNEQEYWAIKNYIINNPKNWKTDRFYT